MLQPLELNHCSIGPPTRDYPARTRAAAPPAHLPIGVRLSNLSALLFSGPWTEYRTTHHRVKN